MAVTMRIVAALLVIAAVWGGKYVVSLIFRAAGVRAGRDARLAGRIPRRFWAHASSPALS